jgi:hypothetical protein
LKDDRDPLARALQEWASHHQAEQPRLDRLAQRVGARVAALPRAADGEAAAWHVMPFLSRLAYAGLGAAVALAVTWGCLFFAPRRAPENGPASRLAGISPEQVRIHERLFKEMERLFTERLRWVAETDGTMSLGVEVLPGAANRAEPVLIRLTVLERREKGPWVPTWNTDVLVRGEEMVEIAPDRKTDNRIAFWVYPLSDGRLAVDTDLSLQAPAVLASQASTVVEDGRPVEIMSLRAGESEYRVIQTVRRLSEKANGNAAG